MTASSASLSMLWVPEYDFGGGNIIRDEPPHDFFPGNGQNQDAILMHPIMHTSTIDFKVRKIVQPEGFLTNFGALNFFGISLEFEINRPIYSDFRRKIRVAALEKAKNLISSEGPSFADLKLSACFFEHFSGLGWRSRFKRRDRFFKEYPNIFKKTNEGADGAEIFWGAEVDDFVLDELSVHIQCIGVLSSLVEREKMLDELSKFVFSAFIKADRISDEFLIGILKTQDIAGFFCFSGGTLSNSW